MKGDFSRWTFNPDNQFTRVLMQQGRVQLDADWNEQVAILLHTMRQMVSDMMGPHGTWDKDAFKVREDNSAYQFNAKGRYYAGGVLVDTTNDSDHWQTIEGTSSGNTLVYLDVWERHLTYVETDEANQPGLREVALKGADTTTRAKVVWKVDCLSIADDDISEVTDAHETLIQEYSNLAQYQEDLAAQIANLNNLAIPPADFDTFHLIFTTLNQIIEPLNEHTAKLTSDLPAEPTVQDVKNSLDKLLDRLNLLIGRFQLDPKIAELPIPVDGSLTEPDQKIVNIVSSLGQLATIITTIARLNMDIQESEQAIKEYQQDLKTKKHEFEKEQIAKMDSRVQLKAITKFEQLNDEDCTIPPDAAYTGPENQLYRVEIHDGSKDNDGNVQTPTFKWSRENGTVIFPIDPESIAISGQEVTVTVESSGRDIEAGLAKENWVELTYDELAESLEPGHLFEVANVDPVTGIVTLKGQFTAPDPIGHPILRRWDQGSDALPIFDKNKEDNKYSHILEKGIHIEFGTGTYRTGDYWLIPARTATRDIEWPQEWDDHDKKWKPKAEPPHGIKHYYAPLVIISDGDVIDCRRVFEQLGQPTLPEL